MRWQVALLAAACAFLTLVGPEAASATSLPSTITSDQTWTAAGSPYTGGSVTINSGVTVTVEPGAVIKLGSDLRVYGTLDVNGTSTDPAVFTSASDSAPAQWWGITLRTDTSTIDHAEVRYSRNGVTIADAASPAITNTEVHHNSLAGIDVSSGGGATITDNDIHDNGTQGVQVDSGGSPEIASNTVTDNTGDYAVGGGIVFTVPTNKTATVNIHDNHVEGNGGGAGIRVWSGDDNTSVTGQSIGGNELEGNAGRALQYQVSNLTGSIPSDIDEIPAPSGNGSDAVWVSGRVTSSTTWDDPGYPLVFMSGYGLRVEDGATLTLGPGLILKGEGTTAGIRVLGTLDAAGEAGDPVTVTSLKDDSVGGDTNGDGAATAPAPGNWFGIGLGYAFATTFGAGTLDYLDLSYGGASYTGMISMYYVAGCGCNRASTITHSRIRNSLYYGVTVNGTPPSGTAPTLNWNRFAGNGGHAIWYGGSGNLLAPNNNFNSDSGPAPQGSGDAVPSNVIWAPLWASGANPCPGPNCHVASDPVSVATGGLLYNHADLTLTNKSKAPLELRRSYDSTSAIDAGFGPGWSYGGLWLASVQESGDVLLRRGDGRRDLFTKTGSTYAPPDGVHDALVKETDGTYTLTTPEQTVYDFDSTGRITSIIDDHGLATTYSYNSSGRLATITDPSSQTLTFSYNAANHITQVADSTGRTVTYTYTGAGDLDAVTDPLNGVTNYDYDSQHRLTSITDPRNVTFLTNTYDSQGRITEQVDGESNHWTLDYGSGQTTVTEPEGGAKVYAFDSQDRLTSVTDELDHTTSYSYDTAGNIDEINRPGGADWAFAHDSAGNLTSITDPLDGEQSLAYDSANRPTSYTDARDKTWSYTWSSNNLTQITDPADNDTGLTYDAAGQTLTVTDPNDHTTTYAYDSRGNRTSVTDPLSHTTSYGYSTRNYLTSKTEPGKSAESYARNALGDLTSVTTPANHTTAYSYDANGAQTGKTDPGNNTWTITRDGMERPTSVTDPLNHSTTIAYDGNLNPVTVTDRRNETTTYTYDDANQRTGIERPEGDTWAFGYDSRGNRSSVTDPRDHTSTYTYDLLDRMTEVDEPLSTTTAYGYDPAGNLTSLTDPNDHQTTFDYDDLGHRTAIHQPLDKDTTFTYDDAGNLVGRTTGEGSLEYSYDDADRLTEISADSNPLRSFIYDPANRLTGATDAQDKTIDIAYNGEDLVTSLDDDRGQTVSRSYDSRGNLTGQTDGRGTLAFSYDALNRMTQLTDPESDAIDFTYDNEGNLTETDLPNGVVTTNTYDGDGRMTETASLNGSTTLQDFTYAYDPTSNRISQVDRNDEETTYSYDALSRLTQFDPPDGPAVDYAYDDAGNRTAAGSATYSYNELNQLTESSDGTDYTYDGAGRLASKDDGSNSTTYSWDPLDQLAEVDDGSNPVSYTYDGLGRRSERTESSATTTDHYGDLSDRPILTTDSTPSTTKSHVQGPGGLVEERAGSTTTYPLADAHGDITTVANGSGAVDSRQSYDPWGNQLSGPSLENGFLGAYQRPTDPSTGLLQMGVRPYAPNLGQFLAQDPVLGVRGLGQSVNRYPYVWDNPLNLYDLDGRTPWGDAWNATGGKAWDATDDARDSIGVAGENSGPNAVSDAVDSTTGWIGRATQDFTKCAYEGLINPSYQSPCHETYQDMGDTIRKALDDIIDQLDPSWPDDLPPGPPGPFPIPLPERR